MKNKAIKILDGIIEGGVLFLIVFSPLAFGSVQVWAQTVIELIIFLMLTSWILKIIIQKKIVFLKKSLSIPILAFIVLILFQIIPLPEFILKFFSGTHRFYNNVSSQIPVLYNLGEQCLSVYRYATYIDLLKIVTCALLFFVIINNINSKKQIKRIFWAIVLTGFFICIFAIIQKFTWNGKIYWCKKIIRGAPFGPYINRDHFAGYINLVIPLSLGLILSRMNNSIKVFIGFITIVMISSLVISVSRGGVLSFLGATIFLSIMFFFFKKAEKKKLWYIAGILGTVVLFVFWLDWAPVIKRLATLADKEGGILFPRLPVWQASMGIVRDFPLLGTGLGTYFCTFPIYRPLQITKFFRYAHNDYLQLFTETGIIGFVIVLSFFILFFKQAIKSLVFAKANKANYSLTGLLIAALTSIVTMLLHSFIDFNLHIFANALLFIIILALVVVMSNLIKDEIPTIVIPVKSFCAYVVGFLFVIGSFLFVFSVGKVYTADKYLRKANIGYNKVKNLEKAVSIDPKNALYHYQLGLTYQKESANQTKSLRERQLLIGQARSEIVQAIKLAPSIGRYWASYAWLVGSSGDYDKATRLFNQALKLDPYNPAIGELMDRMEELKSFKEQ